jgi:hypothetical protein
MSLRQEFQAAQRVVADAYADTFDRLAEQALESEPPSPPTLRSVRETATAKDTNPKDAAATTRIPVWLCSPIAKAHWALAQFAGMVKYGAWNWRKAGVRSSVYLAAAQRHLDAFLTGEELDPADGTHHLGNVMACCAIILDARAAGKLTDDRPPRVSLRRDYAELEKLAEKLRAQYADRNPRHYTLADSDLDEKGP